MCKFEGERCRLIKPYNHMQPGIMGTIEKDPPKGLVLVRWDNGFEGLMCRHEIEIVERMGIDEVYVEE